MTVRETFAVPARRLRRGWVGLRTHGWDDFTRLSAVGDGGGWSVDEDARNVEQVAQRVGIRTGRRSWARFEERQSVFLTSHFEALEPRWTSTSHRLATAYLHGRPGTPGYPEFDRAFEVLRSSPERFHRIQVTHTEMHDLVLDAGVEPAAVHKIPIGIDIEYFPLGDHDARAAARETLGLPQSAFVVGSFQKDGVGWGEGNEPKLIKGPDVLAAALEQVGGHESSLVVLLTGPARGYICRELERRGISYRHVSVSHRTELAQAYRALDVYVVPSRQEGGPKGALEAMASGVPLVTTRVGQVPELVESGRTGLIVEVDSPEAISDAVLRVRDGVGEELTAAAREMAAQYSLDSFDDAWRRLFTGFVEIVR